MMEPTPINLPVHNHPLFPSSRYVQGCHGCHVNTYFYGGYYCNERECTSRFHKECGEASLEINHRSHPQHPLLLTNVDLVDESPCNLCGENVMAPYYNCPTCQFKVDLICGMKPSPPTIEHPMCHEHPLVFMKKRDENVPCDFCKDSIDGPSYSCIGCNVYFHVDCVNLSKEVNHPCHFSHPLKLIASNTLVNDAEKCCLICLKPKGLVYHCSICNFTTCISCTKDPPPLVIEHTNTHKHPLTRVSKRISYTCDVCGKGVTTGLYMCVPCGFAIHLMCIGCPLVVNTNRHDHLISFSHHRAIGKLICGVCHQHISQYKGAYSCYVCNNYAAHPMCAFGGWDGIDYEGIPDEKMITEDIAPYKVVGDNLISHFSHEKHPLKLHKGDIIIQDEHKRCEACSHPLGFGSIYVCEECCFFLHEKCANLPMKKKMIFDIVPYTLKVVGKIDYCNICRLFCDGFKYTAPGRLDIDVRCGSLYEPFIHNSHVHPLYLHLAKGTCGGCNNKIDGFALSCGYNDFGLCLYCVNLPEKIWYKNDAHPLHLCFGEKTSSEYWCDICEGELDPSRWFYTCTDCGVTLHPQCIIGDFSGLMTVKKHTLEVVLNNHNTRPLCTQCQSRCKVPVVVTYYHKQYFCSVSCLFRFVGAEELRSLFTPSLYENPHAAIFSMRRI